MRHSSLYKLFEGGGNKNGGARKNKENRAGGGDGKQQLVGRNKRSDDFKTNGMEKWAKYSSGYGNKVNEKLVKAYSNCILTLVKFVGNDCIKKYTHGTVVHTNRSAPLLSTQKDYQTSSKDIRLIGSLMGFFPEALDSLPIRDGVYKKLTESAAGRVKKKAFYEETSKHNSQVPSYLIWGKQPLLQALHDLLCYLLVCSNPHDVQSASKYLESSVAMIMKHAVNFLTSETIENTIPVDSGSFSVSFDPDATNRLMLMREMCQIYVTSKVSDEDVSVRNVFGQARRDISGRISEKTGDILTDITAFRQSYIDNLRI